ncbi:hypothetical protein RvY_12034 [Ramazzottius varieornatus]|uniref:G-protein coupled receptors family 1 profile domain-containing protein n=1 Tax=Ramazzottius varieornatus TaxID=947166 RepID=A0A1D1VI12_RAMVA|nr:hypothetical protein RvY_12034 [Ramazzottius varieornatus]
MVNLAFCNMLMSAVLPPTYAISSFKGRWVFGYYGCQLHGLIGSMCGTVSMVTITAMALVQCSAMCKPFEQSQASVTARHSKSTLRFIWSYSTFWAFLPLVPPFAPYALSGYLTTCSCNVMDDRFANRVFIGSMCIGVYFVPLLLIIYAYGRIMWITHKETCQRRATVDQGLRLRLATGRRRQTQVESARTIFYFVVGWLWAWTPYAVVAVMAISGAHSYLTPMAYHLPSMLAKTSAVYNPLIYAFSNSRNRTELYHLVRRCFGYTGENESRQGPIARSINAPAQSLIDRIATPQPSPRTPRIQTAIRMTDLYMYSCENPSCGSPRRGGIRFSV